MRELLLPRVGARIRWLDLPGAAPARVFLHGLGSSASFDFPEIAAHPHLARPGRRSVLVDLLGFGFSDRPSDFSYSLGDHARCVGDLLDHLGVVGAELIGHSMGGSIAIILAAQRPELVSRLVVAEPNLKPGGGFWSRAIAAYAERDYAAFGHQEFIARSDPGYAATLRAADPLATHRSAVSLIEGTRPTMGELLARFPGPRAYLVGARNRPEPDEADVLAGGTPVLEVPDAGHAMMGDNPEGFARVLAAALEA